MHKILLIDDSRTVLARTQQILEGAGYEVLTRNQPIGTTAYIRIQKPDLILIDVQMPSISGDNIVSVLRKQPWGANAPVVLHSSLPIDELRERKEACGADGYIQKTNDASAFLLSVKSFLGRTESPPERPRVVGLTVSRGLAAVLKLYFAKERAVQFEWIESVDELLQQVDSLGTLAGVILSVDEDQLESGLQSIRTALGKTPPTVLVVKSSTPKIERLAARFAVRRILSEPVAADALREAITALLS